MLRDVKAEDASAITALNAAAVPNVNLLAEDTLLALAGTAAYARVVETDQTIVGMMLAFAPGTAYESLNYRWFDSRYRDFIYIDRVVVSESARGQGIGKLLYQDVSAFAAGQSASYLTCEVNERPPNPGSMRFHEALGFRTVGHQETDGGAKSVALMLMALPPEGRPLG